MNPVEEKAAEIAAALKKEPEPEALFITLLMIVGIIVNSIRVWQECHKDKESVPLPDLDRLSLEENAVFRKLVRDELYKNDVPLFLTRRVVRHIKENASKTRPEEMRKLMGHALLEGDLGNRYQGYKIEREDDRMTTEEIRRREGLPPMEDA